MRRVVAAAAAAALAFGAACANLGAPPGGPPRTTPPVLLTVTPESGAVNVRAKGVVFTFDEVVGNNDLERVFLMSPEDGRTRVNWHRNRVEVRPRHGFKQNTAYSVTLLPGLNDLRNNSLKTGRTIVFSTGPEIPPYVVLGRVFDWASERPAARATVEVIRHPDSLPYVGIADSSGQFGVGPVGPASYTVLAFLDNNTNRVLDRGEPWDSVAITVGGGTSPYLELLAIPRDTIPPRLMTVTEPDTLTIVATFDRPLDPALSLDAGRFHLVDADSAPLRILSARTKEQADSIDRAHADSAAADSSARGDSLRRATAAKRDTTVLRRGGPVLAPTPKPTRHAPPRDVTIRLDSLTPMHPAKSYRLTAIDVRGLLGPSRSSDRVFTVPRPRVDSTRTGGDSTRARARPPVRPAKPPAKP